MEEKAKKNQINIELKEEVAQGTYSNLAIITHSSSEFILDFVRVMPGIPKAEVKSRVILTPEHAKRLMQALTDNIEKYEKVHGPIKHIVLRNRAIIVTVVHLFEAALASYLAFFIRFEGVIPAEQVSQMVSYLPYLLIIRF